MAEAETIIYRTADGTEIITIPGRKSEYDFKVQYKMPGKRKRTPKHIHIIIDLIMKREHNRELVNKLVEYILKTINEIKPSTSYPPTLQIFSREDAKMFEELDKYGEYSVEFLLVTTELIMIQEKTNYPNGTMNLKLFQRFREGADIFSIVSAATYR